MVLLSGAANATQFAQPPRLVGASAQRGLNTLSLVCASAWDIHFKRQRFQSSVALATSLVPHVSRAVFRLRIHPARFAHPPNGARRPGRHSVPVRCGAVARLMASVVPKGQFWTSAPHLSCTCTGTFPMWVHSLVRNANATKNICE